MSPRRSVSIASRASSPLRSRRRAARCCAAARRAARSPLRSGTSAAASASKRSASAATAAPAVPARASALSAARSRARSVVNRSRRRASSPRLAIPSGSSTAATTVPASCSSASAVSAARCFCSASLRRSACRLPRRKAAPPKPIANTDAKALHNHSCAIAKADVDDQRDQRERQHHPGRRAAAFHVVARGRRVVRGGGGARMSRIGLCRRGAQRVERVVVERSGVGGAFGELLAFDGGQPFIGLGRRGGFGDALGRAPRVVGVIERRDAIGREILHVVERRALRLHRTELVAALRQRAQARREARRAQRAHAAVELDHRRGVAVVLGAGGADPYPQRGQRVDRRARLVGRAAAAAVLVAQRAQWCVLVGTLGADVLAQRVVEPSQRTERRILLRPAVERLRQSGRDLTGRRAVEPDRALARVGGLREHVERDAELRFTGTQRLAVADSRGGVGAAGVVDAHALGVALERAMHFPARAVGGFVGQHGRVRAAAPRPPAVLLTALQPVQRRHECRRQGGFAGLVGAGHDVEPRSEDERAIGEPPEAVDAQRVESQGRPIARVTV